MGLWQALKEGWLSYNKYSMMEMMAFLPDEYWKDEDAEASQEISSEERPGP